MTTTGWVWRLGSGNVTFWFFFLASIAGQETLWKSDTISMDIA
jgi:uncharacterized membrane protein YedE/YeeE